MLTLLEEVRWRSAALRCLCFGVQLLVLVFCFPHSARLAARGRRHCSLLREARCAVQRGTMSASLRNAVKRKTHKERSQPYVPASRRAGAARLAARTYGS